ncbi:MAG: 4'-phosphopantetheinyl transferase superfamily protein [Myxococcales bacterium]|nr:4'-phosphopantetheinyl transferase superfamily protein [Myxococcales bacterium]
MVGNDVVDLSDPESSRDARHVRFDRRVFAPEEFEVLSIEYTDVQRRWILWSAKEAAYKAARRENAGVVFSPARFVVNLDRSLRGSVSLGIHRWPVRVQIDGDCVHAVVSENESFAGTLSGACRLSAAELRDPSQAVRRFAVASIAAQLGVATSDLRIEKTNRIPELIVAGGAAPVALSLSHHGAYAGFACHDSRIEKAGRTSQLIVAGEAAPAALSSSDRGSYPGFAVRSSDARQSGFQ